MPGREPSRHCTGRAAFRPAAMTSSFTDRGLSGYFATGGRPVPEYGAVHRHARRRAGPMSVVEIPTT